MQIEVWDYMGRPHRIDSNNPELLAQWLLETFGRIAPDRSMPCQVQVWPSFDEQPGNTARYDWIVNASYLHPLIDICTPDELIERMTRQLEESRSHAPRD